VDAQALRSASSGDTGTVASLIGLNVKAGHFYSGAMSSTTTDTYGIKVDMGRQNGTLTNSYGLYIGTSGSSTPTNDYGIYQAATGQRNILLGKLGVGVTNPSEKFEISGNIAPETNNTGTVGTSGKRFNAIYSTTMDATGNITTGSNVVAGGNVRPTNDNAGTLGEAGKRWVEVHAVNGTIQTSDRRMKTDIRDSELGLDFILGLRPVSYEWKQPVGSSKGTHYGLIAQELEENLKGRKFAGLVHDDKTDRYSVIYTELIAPLIKSVQELYHKITGHDARIATLEAENARLKSESQAQADLLKDLASRVQKLEGRAPASSARKPASK